ncbi:acyltransferase [Arthrobacter sp. ISL-85]|uniref:acyltransferase family protein n=1 Tax=Arthrobacter sp. ISL-85 TaxID=2819115 RepID=UPI001BE57A6F|nr:acyltransferase [Arthrobacter sp. ISL-85]MBT2568965.1 acyltransferase [Arthrobacter sp. ISL-85]
MKQSNLPWINTARGLAIFLVVLHHSVQWAESAGYGSGAWLHLTWSLATMRLPLFYAISGLLAVKWIHRPMREVLTLKVATLIWLYLLWQLLTVLSYLVVPNVSTPGKGDLRELLTALATPLLPQNSLWFIWALAVFFVLCKLLYGRVTPWAVLAPAAAVSSFSMAGMIHTGNLGWDGLLTNFVFFSAGVYGAALIKGFAEWLNPWTAAVILAGWVLCLVLLPTADAVVLNLGTRAVGLAAGISLGVLLQSSKHLGRAGSNTLTYYLPHYIVLGILAYLASQSGLPGGTANWLPAAMLIITVLICLALRLIARILRCEAWLYGQAPASLTSRLTPHGRQAKMSPRRKSI